MRSLILSLLLAPSLLLTASGAISPVANGSFESPDISPDESRTSGVSGWEFVDRAGPDYSTILFRGDDATDGDQYLEIRTDADDPNVSDVTYLVRDDVGVVFDADLNYRVLFDYRAGNTPPGGLNFTFKVETSIDQGRDRLATENLGAGSFTADWQTLQTDWFTPVVGGDDPTAGDDMRLQLVVKNLDGAGAGVQFDNIRVEFEPLFVLGDFDGNGAVNGLDIPDFKAALADPEGWAAANPDMEHPDDIGDFDDNGSFNGLDIPGFKEALAGEAVPEPATLSLVGLAALGVLRRRR
jgi:hypothetical protein